LIDTISSSHTLGFSLFEKLYGYAPDYSSFRVFYCTCFVLYPHVEHSKLSTQSVICVFLRYGEGKKRYCCFNLVTQKLYVSHHVVFLKHIPFFSITCTTHSLTKSDLIHIDLFSDNSDSLSSQGPSTSDTPSHVRQIYTHHYASTDTLLSSTPEALFSSTVSQASSEIVDPYLRQFICIYKSTKLPNFAYSCYSSSFTFFFSFYSLSL
jgi:hypothetical protein